MLSTSQNENIGIANEMNNRTSRPLYRLLAVGVTLLILVAGGAISYYWLTHRPKAHRRPPKPRATLVEITPVHYQTEQIIVSAMGTIVPARSIELSPRVSGKIIFVSKNFIPGGVFKTDQILLRIDPRDYDLIVKQQEAELQKRQAELKQRSAEIAQRESEITTAESNLMLEMGKQAVARREYQLLGKSIRPEDEAFVLRKPQLESAKAACVAARAAKRSAEALKQITLASISSAEAALKKAKLDLERTVIRAPFDAVIKERFVELGSQVSINERLATLVGIDEFWIKVAVPVDELKWIYIPGFNAEKGSRVRVYYKSAWGPKVFRQGVVKRLMTNLEPNGRMAMLLVSVRDPLNLQAAIGKRHPLFLDSYVRVQIEGRALSNVVKIPRSALHSRKNVWIMKPNNTLEIRPVQVIRSGEDYVIVGKGLHEGELLITSDLAAPVEGMLLQASKNSSNSPRAVEYEGNTSTAKE